MIVCEKVKLSLPVQAITGSNTQAAYGSQISILSSRLLY